MTRILIAALLPLLCAAAVCAQPRTIPAIGAHAADMDLTAGAILAHQKKPGDPH